VSLDRLEEHRRIWAEKPVLGDVYSVWFEALLGLFPSGARVLEVGAGPGFLSAQARQRPDLRWIASDLVAAPWNDLAADASRLPLRDASVDGIAALDLVHHLARPGAFFGEAARVLRPGGRLAAVEPWVTPLSYPIYRWLHQEGCTPGLDPWDPFRTSGGAAKGAFEGDAAVLRQILRHTPAERWSGCGLRPPRVELFNGFAYLLSLGFRNASLLPRRLAPWLIHLDRRASAFASVLGMRALAVWERA
jgi:SAM-dependent methyltransferase